MFLFLLCIKYLVVYTEYIHQPLGQAKPALEDV